MTRLTRDGHEVSVGPVLSPRSVRREIASRLATILLVPAVILIVAWIAGEGFVVSVPVEVEHEDAPASEAGP